MTGMGNAWKSPPWAWVLLLFALPPAAEAAFVRANCRGIQEFSTSRSEVSCQESSVLDDESDRLMLGHTRASASLPRGLLLSSAAGGQIRDVGANGGEAGALLMDRLTISGDWTGSIAVTVRLCIDYTFAGFGESRIHATLRGSSADNSAGGNQARVQLSHRGLGGAALADFGSRGSAEIPAEGPHPLQSRLVLSITEIVQPSAPQVNVRADIAVFALPNLDALEPVLSSFGRVVAWVLVSLPDALEFSSESGVFLSDPYAREAAGTKRGQQCPRFS